MKLLWVPVARRQRAASGGFSLSHDQLSGPTSARSCSLKGQGKGPGRGALVVGLALLAFVGWTTAIAQPTGNPFPVVISCPPNVEIQCGASVDPSHTGQATAITACGVPATVWFIDAPLPGDCAGGGILRTWIAEACGARSLGCVQTIRFVDTTPPEFQVVPLIDDAVFCGMPIPPPPPVSVFQVIDNCDPSPFVTLSETQTVPGPDGGYLITRIWTATDLCGNSSVQSQSLFVNGCLGQVGVEVLPEVSGTRFYDANANGIRDPGEPPIPGWKMLLSGGPAHVSLSAVTDANGRFVFSGLIPGAYALDAALPLEPGWFNTTATPILVAEAASESRDLGALRVGGGSAQGLGFWTNRGGQRLLADIGALERELAVLRAFHLRQADGAGFDPDSYPQLKNWLQGAKGVNMAYMLSAHLSAIVLSRDMGLIDDEALVQAPGLSSANSLGYAKVKGLIAEANAELRRHPLTAKGSIGAAFRPYQEALQSALQAVTANANVVQPTPTAVSFGL